MMAECNFTNVVKGPFQAYNLGYSVAKTREGHGIMTAVVKKGIEIMFNEYGLHRIMANYMLGNARSGRVLERCGFVREGYAKAYLKTSPVAALIVVIGGGRIAATGRHGQLRGKRAIYQRLISAYTDPWWNPALRGSALVRGRRRPPTHWLSLRGELPL